MLETIVINNFTIIDRAHIDFDGGMTALTGETGAGKSILLDAIKLVLGDRADSDSVKSGCDKADIAVSFNLEGIPQAIDWLQQQQLDQHDECLLRRVVQSNGRSRAYINGSPVPLTQLRELGEMLVDIHGQHEHQSLQKPAVQQQLLDSLVSDHSLFERVRAEFQSWRQCETQLQQAMDSSAEKQQRIDLLQVHSRELRELDLQENEITRLREEHHRLSHAGQILENMTSLIATLYDNDQFNVQHGLAQCVDQLTRLTDIDASLKGAADLLQNALIHVQEVATDLRAYQDAIDLDPARLEWLNSRLSQAESLARKHRVDAEGLVALRRDIDQQLDQLQLNEQDLQRLQQQALQARGTYLNAARELSALRQRTAAGLSTQITEVMQTLGMQGGQFSIHVQSMEQEERFSADGIDRVEFQVSANPGQPLKPLHKVASGGELSRISLAIQVILSAASQIPTLIFDEVDSGIGGGIAEIVGRKLRLIAGDRQVFCVTHLPQVASQAHQHYRVSKSKTEDTTSTEVSALDDQQRLEEIARMLGGMTITDQTRAHAREMLSNVA